MPCLPGAVLPLNAVAWFGRFDPGEVVLAAAVVIAAAGLVRCRGALRRVRTDGDRRFRNLIEAAPVGIVVHDRERVLYMNDHGRRRLGVPAGALPDAATCGELLGPAAVDTPPGAADDTAPWRLVRAGDGRTVEVHTTDSAFAGQPARLTFFRDVPSEMSAQQELAENRERLALALEAARDGVWDLNLATGVITGSPAFGTVLNPGEPAPGTLTDWLALVHPEDRERVVRIRETVAPSLGARYECELRVVRRDGGTAWILELARVVSLDGNGRPSRLAGTVHDITARKRAERRLDVRSRLAASFLAARGEVLRTDLGVLLQEILETPCSCVGMYDTGGRLRLACSCREPDATPRHTQLAPDAVPAAFQRVLEATGPVTQTDAGHDPDGPRSPLLGVRLASGDRVLGLVAVAGRAAGYRHDDAETLAGIAEDLAPLVQSHLEAEAKDAQLAQAQKMEALGVLAGGIAHDFNNILQAILGFSSLARQDSHDPERLGADLDRVERATVRGRDLVQRILQFSRPGDPEAPLLDPVPLLHEIVLELRTKLSAGIILETDLAGDCGLVRAAAPPLRQALMDLATNGWQALAAGGGTLRISARPWTVPDDDRRFPPDWQGREVVEFAVADTGPGIPEAHRPRLFDPFFTTREVGQGAGLGLSVVHGLVSGLGGRVLIDCPAGGGTVAAVYLPRMDPAGRAATAGLPPVHTAIADGVRRGRVLFVDDDPEIRDLAAALLGRAGYQVETAPDGLIASERLLESPCAFDVVITDQQMPGLNGRELALRIKALRSDLPVILLTGLGGPTRPAGDDGQLFREVVTKPFFGQSLYLAVRRALEGGPGRNAGEPPPLDTGH